MGEPKQVPCHCCAGKGSRPCYVKGDSDHCDCWSNGEACCACGDDGEHASECGPARVVAP